MLTQYATVLVFLAVGALFPIVTLLLGRLLRPRVADPNKLLPYECGEEAIGSPWVRFNIRFYTIALIFIIFEVEIVFLFPWATVFRELGVVSLIEMAIFIGVLLVGLAYVWRKGDLEWVKPRW